jgi:hypothetical protein
VKVYRRFGGWCLLRTVFLLHEISTLEMEATCSSEHRLTREYTAFYPNCSPSQAHLIPAMLPRLYGDWTVPVSPDWALG